MLTRILRKAAYHGAANRPLFLVSRQRSSLLLPFSLASSSFSSAVEDDEETEQPSMIQKNNIHEVESSEIGERNLRPSEVMKELDLHIVGQNDAKRSVAIALRNRWRRRKLSEDLRKEVTPRNVLLVGPTGCGKTEVARRMAALNNAPFLKVEATKFTEVGYHGRDVDQIIRDLMDVSMQLAKKSETEKLREQAKTFVEERLLDLLTGPSTTNTNATDSQTTSLAPGGGSNSSSTRGRESFRTMLREGLLDDQEVTLDVPQMDRNEMSGMGAGDGSNPNLVAMSDLLQRLSGSAGGKMMKQATERKKLPISEARGLILDMELDRMLSNVDLPKIARAAVEESGIVFIDEIDKICSPRESYSYRNSDASSEGVQRDLLPLVEGTTINTKYGNVNTDYILFVASGAFHAVKPSDLLPELQGRFPIRVELHGLTEEDLYRILTEPVANLIRQQVDLIATEGVKLTFDDGAIREIARMAAHLNKTVENIGARRLHTVLEKIMEPISFSAAEPEKHEDFKVDKAFVAEQLKDITLKSDLSKYIL